MPESVSSPGRRTTRKGDRPLVLNGRKRFITALSALAMAAAIGFVPGTAQADPDIEDVESRVDRLYHEAEQASERYNDAKLELSELEPDVVVPLRGHLRLVVEAIDPSLDILDVRLRLGRPRHQADGSSHRHSGKGSDESLPAVQHERAVSLARRTPTR